MKRLTLLNIGLVIGLAGCIIINPGGVKGSGIAKTEKRSVASFDSLDVKYVGSIQVRSQGQESLAISGDDNIIPFITTEIARGYGFNRSVAEITRRGCAVKYKGSIPEVFPIPLPLGGIILA